MTSDELKQALSEDNNYDYIYLGNDITATSGFVINSKKNKQNQKFLCILSVRN